MIRFDFRGEKWAILFRHDHMVGTSCIVVKEEGLWDEGRLKGKMKYRVMGEGSTSLNPVDRGRYKKEFGRKMSLKRALDGAGILDKKERLLVWRAYFGRFEEEEYYVK